MIIDLIIAIVAGYFIIVALLVIVGFIQAINS
jgi:hypothetical protein